MKIETDSWWPPKFDRQGYAWVSLDPRGADGTPCPGVFVTERNTPAGTVYSVDVPKRWKAPPAAPLPAAILQALTEKGTSMLVAEDLVSLRCMLIDLARLNGIHVGDDDGA
jgi:hypothetical protein